MEAGEGGEEREGLDGGYGGVGGQAGAGYGEEGYANDGGNGDHVHGEANPDGPGVAFPTSVYRESLGFLRARKKLTLPGVGLEPGEVDDGCLAALAVMERFGFLLVSCATGELDGGMESTHRTPTPLEDRGYEGGIDRYCLLFCCLLL